MQNSNYVLYAIRNSVYHTDYFLRVKLSELDELNIADKISNKSFMTKKYVYLSELDIDIFGKTKFNNSDIDQYNFGKSLNTVYNKNFFTKFSSYRYFSKDDKSYLDLFRSKLLKTCNTLSAYRTLLRMDYFSLYYIRYYTKTDFNLY